MTEIIAFVQLNVPFVYTAHANDMMLYHLLNSDDAFINIQSNHLINAY